MSKVRNDLAYLEEVIARRNEKIAELEATIAALREQVKLDLERVCALVIEMGFSTGHADTMYELLGEATPQFLALREQVRWVPVSERLPPIDTPVLVVGAAWRDQITCAMRYEDDDGWLWGQLTGYNATLNRADSYEFDDEYEYTHWMPLPTPPQENGK